LFLFLVAAGVLVGQNLAFAGTKVYSPNVEQGELEF
jgi:hypothetical protein